MPKVVKRKSKYTLGNFKLKVKKSGTGKGLFALEDIPKNSCVAEYFGTRVPEKDDEGYTVNGNVKGNVARYINHSCKPNCEAIGPKGKVFIFSIKNIKAGEELTYDYGKEYFNEHIKPFGCKCVLHTGKDVLRA
jgi:SET domain-containing protein